MQKYKSETDSIPEQRFLSITSSSELKIPSGQFKYVYSSRAIMNTFEYLYQFEN